MRTINATTGSTEQAREHHGAKECFVCQMELKSTSPPVELWYRQDGAAHTECVWRAAKLLVDGEE